MTAIAVCSDVWWQHEVNPIEEAPEIAARVTLYVRLNRAA